MLVVYKTVPNEEIQKEGEELKQKIKQFFVDNPKRRVCRLETWYGKLVTIKKNQVEQGIDEAVKNALK